MPDGASPVVFELSLAGAKKLYMEIIGGADSFSTYFAQSNCQTINMICDTKINMIRMIMKRSYINIYYILCLETTIEYYRSSFVPGPTSTAVAKAKNEVYKMMEALAIRTLNIPGMTRAVHGVPGRRGPLQGR